MRVRPVAVMGVRMKVRMRMMMKRMLKMGVAERISGV